MIAGRAGPLRGDGPLGGACATRRPRQVRSWRRRSGPVIRRASADAGL